MVSPSSVSVSAEEEEEMAADEELASVLLNPPWDGIKYEGYTDPTCGDPELVTQEIGVGEVGMCELLLALSLRSFAFGV